jgi:hypothetical protein
MLSKALQSDVGVRPATKQRGLMKCTPETNPNKKCGEWDKELFEDIDPKAFE